MHDQENTNLLATWEHAYGPTFVYRGFIGAPRLMTTDPVAIAHILHHAYAYPKPDFVRDSLATMAAGHDGLLTTEGDQHRKQRRIIAPAFSKLHLDSLTPIFWDKAVQLRDLCLQQADAHDDAPRIDVLSWLARATLDVIGEAGFGYRFDALSSQATHNELSAAFAVIFSTARKFRVMTILQAWFPVLRRFAHATMERIGLQLIDQKRTEILADASSSKTASASTPRTRDLLGLLIRSNLSSASASVSPHEKPHAAPPAPLNTREVLSQISTFIAAGHETSASALTWCLYALARDTASQARLRAELRRLALEHEREKEQEREEQAQDEHEQVQGSGGEGDGDGDALAARVQACTYLDWVVREALRMHAPVTSTMRVCARPGGDVVPLSVPVRAGAGKQEKEHVQGTGSGSGEWSVRVAEGDIITIPIQAVNRCTRLWGADAGEFRPERWADLPAGARSIPGLLSGMLTFLNGNGSVGAGNRACIGWRFALAEIKIFLYVLVKDMEFWIDDGMVIEKRIK
ncbi:hypothetical protein H0H81_002291 [Sphagnurus paluster]|uniref:Cytochrome P450 n=1 Tax=Sphagnurus paluster TaxID=117069 RepID=A0A9P7FZT6_9AGAR|nr:hypothetical protein H0H81_002291 [Sphagnurus paluster]